MKHIPVMTKAPPNSHWVVRSLHIDPNTTQAHRAFRSIYKTGEEMKSTTHQLHTSGYHYLVAYPIAL